MLVTVLLIKPVLEYPAVGVQEVYHCVGVRLVAGCEHHKLEFVLEFIQQGYRIRPDTHMGLDCLASRHYYRQAYVVVLTTVLAVVNQSFIQVEHQSLLSSVALALGQLQLLWNKLLPPLKAREELEDAY